MAWLRVRLVDGGGVGGWMVCWWRDLSMMGGDSEWADQRFASCVVRSEGVAYLCWGGVMGCERVQRVVRRGVNGGWM